MNSQSGFTLVGNLIAMALGALALGLLIVLFQQQSADHRAAAVRGSFQDVEKAFVAGLERSLRAYAAGACGDQAALAAALAATKFGNGGRMTLTTAPAFSGLKPPDTQVKAQGRCEHPHATVPKNAPGVLYFCLKLDRPPQGDTPRESFFDSDYAFVEVYGRMTDAQTGGTLTCNNWATLPSSALSLYYSVYWGRGDTREGYASAFSRKNGTDLMRK